MQNTKELYLLLKSLFSAPLGSFPIGGLESSLKVSVGVSPYEIWLTSQHTSLRTTLKLEAQHYLVEDVQYTTLNDALLALITPHIKAEINSRLTKK